MITNLVEDEYIQCTVAADPSYMASEFEGKSDCLVVFVSYAWWQNVG